ncbi:MAG: hypothetical protein FWH16_02560 [Oscillospiraceae bacterium]|nr:hypothetical protein [Oscillospiraceae bacterium]
MNSFFDEVVIKVREGAEIAADVAEQAAKNVKASVKKSVDISALNTKIKRLKLEISTEFMEIGELVYQTHKDPDTSAEELPDRVERIDGLYAELEEVKAERDRRMSER